MKNPIAWVVAAALVVVLPVLFSVMSAAPPPPIDKAPTFMFSLGLTLNDDWSEAKVYDTGLATVQFDKGEPCRETDCPLLQVYDTTRFLPLDGKIEGGEYVDTDRCPGSDAAFAPAVKKGQTLVGGETAVYYESPPCAGNGVVRRLWFVPQRDILILGLPATDGEHVPLEKMNEMLTNASWK